jgi:hypothetical protein
MGLEIAQRRVRLAVQELNARTVPALLTGLEADVVADTEQVAFTEELQTDDASEFAITSLVADESSLLFEFSIEDFAKPEENAENTQFGEELPVATDGDFFERPIKPYYRSLDGESGEVSEVTEATEDAQLFEMTSEEIDPTLMFMTSFGVEGGGEVSEVIEGEWAELAVTSEPKLEDVILYPEETTDDSAVLYYFGGIADSGVSEGGEEGSEVVELTPLEIPDDELMFYSTVHDCPIMEETPVEGPVEVTSELVDPIVDFTPTWNDEIVLEATGEEIIDPTVYFMPLVNDEVAFQTAVIDEAIDEVESSEDSLLSAFTFDDFTATDTVEDTQEVEVTQEITTEEPVAKTEPVTVSEPSATKPRTIGTDYFSIDGDMLEQYLGLNTKKRSRF